MIVRPSSFTENPTAILISMILCLEQQKLHTPSGWAAGLEIDFLHEIYFRLEESFWRWRRFQTGKEKRNLAF